MNNDIKKIIEAFDFNQVKNDKNKNYHNLLQT